jgi:hypothetical protein
MVQMWLKGFFSFLQLDLNCPIMGCMASPKCFFFVLGREFSPPYPPQKKKKKKRKERKKRVFFTI